MRRSSLFSATITDMAIILMVTLFTATCSDAAEATSNRAVDRPLLLHGRLSFYNGSPSFRIWVVGTHKIMGVQDADKPGVTMPRELLDILSQNLSDIQIFADFEVIPLTEPKKGVMQIVRINAAKNIIVTHRDLAIIRRVEGEVRRR
jgi:hypothetical protein